MLFQDDNPASQSKMCIAFSNHDGPQACREGAIEPWPHHACKVCKVWNAFSGMWHSHDFFQEIGINYRCRCFFFVRLVSLNFGATWVNVVSQWCHWVCPSTVVDDLLFCWFHSSFWWNTATNVEISEASAPCKSQENCTVAEVQAEESRSSLLRVHILQEFTEIGPHTPLEWM